MRSFRCAWPCQKTGEKPVATFRDHAQACPAAGIKERGGNNKTPHGGHAAVFDDEWERPVRRLSAIVILERRRLARRREARAQIAAAVDLISLGVKLDGHQAQPFGASQIKATAGDAEAVFGLAAEEFGCDHND